MPNPANTPIIITILIILIIAIMIYIVKEKDMHKYMSLTYYSILLILITIIGVNDYWYKNLKEIVTQCEEKNNSSNKYFSAMQFEKEIITNNE